MQASPEPHRKPTMTSAVDCVLPSSPDASLDEKAQLAHVFFFSKDN